MCRVGARAAEQATWDEPLAVRHPPQDRSTFCRTSAFLSNMSAAGGPPTFDSFLRQLASSRPGDVTLVGAKQSQALQQQALDAQQQQQQQQLHQQHQPHLHQHPHKKQQHKAQKQQQEHKQQQKPKQQHKKQRAPQQGQKRKQPLGAQKQKGGGPRKASNSDTIVLAQPKKLNTQCTFFLRGACHKGEKCRFLHEGKPSVVDDICRFHLSGHCEKSGDCLFSHDLSKLPCRYYHTVGCTFDGCRFSHGPLTEAGRRFLDTDVVEHQQRRAANSELQRERGGSTQASPAEAAAIAVADPRGGGGGAIAAGRAGHDGQHSQRAAPPVLTRRRPLLRALPGSLPGGGPGGQEGPSGPPAAALARHFWRLDPCASPFS